MIQLSAVLVVHACDKAGVHARICSFASVSSSQTKCYN